MTDAPALAGAGLLRRLLGAAAGVDLRPSGLAQAAIRLASARGVLQVVASALTGTGLACFVMAAMGHLAWSWPLWLLAVVLMLCVDSAFNTVLNAVQGFAFAILLILRVALTVALGYVSTDMLMVLAHREGVEVEAKALAGARYTHSHLNPAKSSLKQSAALVEAAQKAQADFEVKTLAAATVDSPQACQMGAPVLSDDPAQRRTQQRAFNQQQRMCEQSMARSKSAGDAKDKADQELRKSLSDALASATQQRDADKAAWETAQSNRTQSVQHLARSVPLLTQGLHATMDSDEAMRTQFRSLLVVIYILEGLALLAKVTTARVDQAALNARNELNQAAYAADVDKVCIGALRNAARCPLGEVARNLSAKHYVEEVQAAMHARSAINKARHRGDALERELGSK